MDSTTRCFSVDICCANGIIKTKKALKAFSSIDVVRVDLASKLVYVTGDVDPNLVVTELRRLGFKAEFYS